MADQPIQIDGDKVITLRLKNSAVLFMSGVLGAQPSSVVTQHGQEGLLRELANQQAEQNGLGPQQPTLTPPGPAVALPNRAVRRATKRK